MLFLIVSQQKDCVSLNHLVFFLLFWSKWRNIKCSNDTGHNRNRKDLFIMSYFVEMLSQVPTINPIQSPQGKQKGKVIWSALARVSLSVAQVLKLLFTKGMKLFSRPGHVQQLFIPFEAVFKDVAPLCLEQISFLKGSLGASWEILSYPNVTSWLERNSERGLN